jgi:DUF971 family protein
MLVAEPLVPTSAAPAPERISVSTDRATLVMSFDTGTTRALAATTLRAACRCASCSRARIEKNFPDRFDAVTISTVSAIGTYGINVGFSDGHARGIYPWSYLAQLLDN